MTRLRQASMLVLVALIATLGSKYHPNVSAAERPVEAPQTTQRFVLFESFLNPT